MALASSVVVGDLNIEGVAPGPLEADPPLLVDSNAALPRSITLQPLQSVSRGCPEVVDPLGSIYEQQLAVGSALHVWRQDPRSLSPKGFLGLFIREAPDHGARA
jgi:hypothetical protein